MKLEKSWECIECRLLEERGTRKLGLRGRRDLKLERSLGSVEFVTGIGFEVTRLECGIRGS